MPVRMLKTLQMLNLKKLNDLNVYDMEIMADACVSHSLFKQLCMKISVGHDIIFHNKGLHKVNPIVYLHRELRAINSLASSNRYYTSS